MRSQYQQIIDKIQKSRNILITFGKNHTGDALSSALALYLFLKKHDKNVYICSPDFKEPKSMAFLPGIKEIKKYIKTGNKFIISLDIKNKPIKEISYQKKDDSLSFLITPDNGYEFKPEHVSTSAAGHDYDLIIIVSTPDLESLGSIYHDNTEFFFSVPMINIDHHPDNEEYGQINFINITALATAEVMFKILKNFSTSHIDKNIATCLLAGIIAESKSFKVGSLTPQSLLTASKLIELGADKDLIVKNFYQNRNLNTLKLWGRVLAKLNYEMDGKIIWSSLNKVDFEKTNSHFSNLEEVVDELIVNIPEAKIIALLAEDTKHTKIKVNIYTAKNINAMTMVKEFNPTGIKNRAVIESPQTLIELEKNLIQHLKNKLVKLPI